ncbi:MAG: hypothetical protein KF795_01545 [Labilithrix sp.]|nr:hypothetical protein [Labilithrix sp.]
MAFDAIAYGPDDLCLLTIDGAELLAYDAVTEGPKWRLSFEHALVAVLFVDPQALPAGQGGSPWRSPGATGRSVLALDAEGHLHLVDPTLGQVSAKLGPFGKPRALASSPAAAAVALAVDDAVFVLRSGARIDVPLSASASGHVTALAFSADGATLAAGTDKGELRMFHVAEAPEETFRADLRGAVSDLAQHPSGSWLIAGRDGVSSVGPSGVARLEKLPAGVKRARFDANGGRVAIQRSDRSVIVYEWPSLSVTMRIEYTDRPVHGIAFGPGNWLGLALDHGDGNKIDVVTSSTHRTDTHAGREHRSWTLMVEGKAERLSAKEAEDIKRMKAAFHAPPKSNGNGVGARIGIGAMISIALLAVRVCVRSSTPHTSYNYKPNVLGTAPLGTSCDRACARGRIERLAIDCESATLACSDDANAALKALADGDCAGAKAALGRIESVPTSPGRGGDAPLFGANRLLAKFGLDEACASGAIRPRPVTHAQLVTLTGPTREPTVERIPDAEPGEQPRAVWVAPDGTAFIATTAPDDAPRRKCVVYRRTKAGEWATVHEALGGTRASLFGRTSSDVYLMTNTALERFDGATWKAVPAPSLDHLSSATVSGADVFFAGLSDAVGQVHRRRGDTWTKEPVPEGLIVTEVFGGGASVWALADDPESEQALLQRSSAGAWVVRTPSGDAGSSTMYSVWTSPTGDTFVATDEGVLRSTNGASWKTLETPGVVTSLWGRSSRDVYGTSVFGLVHYDGSKWTETSYSGRIGAVSGTATELFVVRAAE